MIFLFLLTAPTPYYMSTCMNLITQTELKQLFVIDPLTGHCQRLDGRKTGSASQKGYVRISVRGREYRAHRLVWLWVHGEHPSEGMTIDHINGIKTDNRIANLRLATICENVAYYFTPTDFRNINRERNGFRVEMIVSGKRYRRRAATLEKALQIREEMYAKFPALASR